MLIDLIAIGTIELGLLTMIISLSIPEIVCLHDPNCNKAWVSDNNVLIEWANIEYDLRAWEVRVHQDIANYVKTTLETPISSPLGLSGALAGGATVATVSGFPSTLSHQIEDVYKVRLAVMILRSMNAFITRGKDPCNDTGPNGAWHKWDRLSYCGPDKIMMNIILANGKKAVNKIHNAGLLSMQYGVTTEWLTVNSLACHQKFQGKGKFDAQTWFARPITLESDCISDLPVCDFTEPKNKPFEHEHTVTACRRFGVPI